MSAVIDYRFDSCLVLALFGLNSSRSVGVEGGGGERIKNWINIRLDHPRVSQPSVSDIQIDLITFYSC